MTLTTSWGGATTDAYADATAVDSFLGSSVVRTISAWTDASTAQKEAAIREATADIDALHWMGHGHYSEQMLAFPRDQWAHGSIVGSLCFQRVQQAVAIQALHILNQQGILADSDQQAAGIASRAYPGPAGGTVTFTGGGTRLHPQAKRLLREYLASGPALTRG